MAVRYILSFDGFGEAAASDNRPKHGAGLTNHPAKPSYTNNTDGSGFAIGVSGLRGDMFGDGATLRNALTMVSVNPSGNAITAVNAVFPVAATLFPQVAGVVTYIGFRFRRVKDPTWTTETTSSLSLMALNLVSILEWNPNSKALTVPSGTSSMAGVPFDFKDGQEYYIELELTRTTAVNFSFALFVDGVELYRTGGSRTISPVNTIRLGSSSAYHNNWKSKVHFGDLYVGDERIGPQMILTRQPTRVIESNWSASEGNDPLALLTGTNADDDGKFITSPADNSADRYRMDFSLPAGYKAHAAELYVRAKRNPGSDRTVAASVINVQSDAEVTPDGKVPYVFSQNQYETTRLWSTGTSEDLVPNNINNLAMTLSSPKV